MYLIFMATNEKVIGLAQREIISTIVSSYSGPNTALAAYKGVLRTCTQHPIYVAGCESFCNYMDALNDRHVLNGEWNSKTKEEFSIKVKIEDSQRKEGQSELVFPESMEYHHKDTISKVIDQMIAEGSLGMTPVNGGKPRPW